MISSVLGAKSLFLRISVNVFPYSKRKGTKAYNLPDLPSTIKKQRVDILEKVNQELSNKYLSKFISARSTMLAEEKKEMWEADKNAYFPHYQ